MGCRFYTRKHAGPREIIKRLSANNIRAEQKEAKKIEKEKKDEEAKKIEKESAAKNGGKTAEVEASVESKKGADASAEPKKEKPKEVEKPKEEEKKDEAKVTPLCPRPAQNWSDLFFILDSLSYN